MAYILKIDQLRPGDIILERDYTEQSHNIRQFTHSEYSHAYLYRGNCSIVEADGTVVKTTNPQRLLFEEPDDVVVLRCSALTEQQSIQICNYATKQFGREYSTKRYAKDSSGDNIPIFQNRQYCTKLVAKSYEAVGLKIVKNSDICSPQHILDSDLLERVHNVIKEPTDNELEMVIEGSILDRHGYEWGIVLSQIRNIGCVKKYPDSDIQDRDQLFAFVEKHPDVDGEVAEILHKSNYFSMWMEYHVKNPWDYDAEQLIEKYGDDSFTAAWNIYSTNAIVLDSWKHDLYDFLKGHSTTQLGVYKVFADLYANLVADSELRAKASKKVIIKYLTEACYED